MSRQTQGRRWSASLSRRRASPMTENAVMPEEARTAINAIVLQTGHKIDHVTDYDPRADRFTVRVIDSESKRYDMTIYGEAVARTVAAARTMSGQPRGLLRPYEKRAAQCH